MGGDHSIKRSPVLFCAALPSMRHGVRMGLFIFIINRRSLEMSWRIDIQNATPASAREFINNPTFGVSDKLAADFAKKEFARIRTSMLAVVDALPKQGLLVSFYGGGEFKEDGVNNGNLAWSTTVVPKNQYSMYAW